MVAPNELMDSVAPHSIGFRMDDGKATAQYKILGPEVRARALDVIGWNLEGEDGRIIRSLPATFPHMPFLFASSINLVGYGIPEWRASDPAEVVADDEDSEDAAAAADRTHQIRAAPIAPIYALYPEYTANVEFLQRPYHVLPDDEIDVLIGQWYDENGDEQSFWEVHEWERFVEIDEKYDPRIITATQGQMVFRTDDLSAPHGAAFAGQPRIPMPEQTLTLRWHQVPYRYISSRKSFLKRFAMRVNQDYFRIQGYTFEPGEALYLGFSYRRYTSPFPMEDEEHFGRFVLEKWVDIDIHLSIAIGREPPAPPQLPNPNWITARGHNCLPWFGPASGSARGFHYVSSFRPTAPDDQSAWEPTFLSFPLSALWCDPDIAPPPE